MPAWSMMLFRVNVTISPATSASRIVDSLAEMFSFAIDSEFTVVSSV